MYYPLMLYPNTTRKRTQIVVKSVTEVELSEMISRERSMASDRSHAHLHTDALQGNECAHGGICARSIEAHPLPMVEEVE